MRKNFQNRPLMMIAGVLAAAIILFSQSFYHEAQSNIERIKSEQSSPEKDVPQTVISAPSDAVVNSSVENVNEQVPTLLEELFTTDQESKAVSIVPTFFANFFKTLVRAFISPNAP